MSLNDSEKKATSEPAIENEKNKSKLMSKIKKASCWMGAMLFVVKRSMLLEWYSNLGLFAVESYH